jgi:hypothetical protein
MKATTILCALFTLTTIAKAQDYALDPQTGQHLPLTGDGQYAIYPDGHAVPVVHSQHSVNCEQAEDKLRRSHEMARRQGQPLPRNMEDALQQDVQRLCQ